MYVVSDSQVTNKACGPLVHVPEAILILWRQSTNCVLVYKLCNFYVREREREPSQWSRLTCASQLHNILHLPQISKNSVFDNFSLVVLALWNTCKINQRFHPIPINFKYITLRFRFMLLYYSDKYISDVHTWKMLQLFCFFWRSRFWLGHPIPVEKIEKDNLMIIYDIYSTVTLS